MRSRRQGRAGHRAVGELGPDTEAPTISTATTGASAVVHSGGVSDFLAAVRAWAPRRWVVAAGTAVLTIGVVGVPTVLIPNPWFGREVPVTWWAWPALIMTALLAGLTTATYVRSPLTPRGRDRAGRAGMIGGVLSFFAVGCPVCNKLVLLALGASGALTYFGPVQPLLAAVSIALLAGALVVRVRRENSCAVTPPSAASG